MYHFPHNFTSFKIGFGHENLIGYFKKLRNSTAGEKKELFITKKLETYFIKNTISAKKNYVVDQ